jgi:DNA-directed RNA polymerase specialized sigma24 family protein
MEFSIRDGATAVMEPAMPTYEQQSLPVESLLEREQFDAGEASANDVLEGCLRQIGSWRIPPNWSRQDWMDEMRTDAAEVLWKASQDYDPTRGVPLEAFERLRVLAGARTRYRQEWQYALHCGCPIDAVQEDCLLCESCPTAATCEPLGEALRQIPEADRRLIEQLFLGESTEATVACQLGISQQAVSKRKHAALKQLGRWLDA